MLGPVLLWVAALVFGAVFFASLGAHVRRPGRAEAIVLALGFPRGVAYLNIWSLALVMVMLVLSPAAGGVAAAGYLVAVSAVLAARSASDRIEDCGCFEQPHAVGVSLFLRNATLILLGTLVAVFGPRGFPLLSMVAGALAGVFAVALVVPRPMTVSTDQFESAQLE